MAIIKQTHSDCNPNDHSTTHFWNKDDDVFDHKLEKWGVGKVLLIKLNLRQESWYLILNIETINIKKTDQRSHTTFLEEYGGISLYDEDLKKRYRIYHSDIHFVNNNGLDLIETIDEPDGTSTNHDYSPIRDGLFNIILAKNNNVGILQKIISQNVSSSIIN